MSLSGTESFIGSSEKNSKNLDDPQWLEHEVQAFEIFLIKLFTMTHCE